MPESHDQFESYYAAKLWGMLPAVYRAEDSPTIDETGPLKELVQRIARQGAILRRSIDRLLEDQSIESCEDWLIPYLGDLLATNLVSGLDPRGQRVDVAKTIYYRRRKGTVGLLEELAADITGWEAKIVEFFRLLGRTRHRLDPAIGLPSGDSFPDALQVAQQLVGRHTRTAQGGWANLRNRYGASRAHTGFDELMHFADFRPGRGPRGWHNIPRLGVFLWRRKSFHADFITPVPMQGCANQFSFDPTGRQIALYSSASRKADRNFGDRWTSPEEWQLPTAIDRRLYSAYSAMLYPDDPNKVRSLGVWNGPFAAGFNLIERDEVEVFPELGRFRLKNPPPAGGILTSYHYGFPSTLGAGPYDRKTRGELHTALPEISVNGGGVLTAAATGTTTITDSLTYTSAAAVGPLQEVVVRSANETRPLVRLAPGTSWRFTGQAGGQLTLDGFWVSGGDIVLDGEFDTVIVRMMTLDPGSSDLPKALYQSAVDGRPLVPTRLWIEGSVRRLVVQRSILGPIRIRNAGVLEELVVSDSILQAIPTSTGSTFTTANVFDPSLLAKRLRRASDAVAAHLVAGFSSTLRTALRAYDENQTPSAQLLNDVVTALNQAVGGPSLYKPERFQNVPLTAATKALAESNPGGTDLVRFNHRLLLEAFAIELGSATIALADGRVQLERVTVLGSIFVRQMEVSESILTDRAVVEDTQRGCVRFSAWTAGSILPRKYESVELIAGAPLFESRDFGHPGYAQLLASANTAIRAPAGEGSILEGAQNGSEMGAYHRELFAIKQRSLLIKYQEYMPLGLVPVVVNVT